MSGLRRLLRELHRRSLWQVLLIYVGASWAVIEAVQGLTEATGLPEWFPSFAVGLLLIGFPVVMATAFVQEGLGGGDASDGSGPATAGADEPGAGTESEIVTPAPARQLLTWRNAIGGGVLAMALWGVVATVWLVRGQPTADASSAIDPGVALATVAVLPFDNLSPDADNAFFAAGVHEDILTQLSKIHDLTVISRTSVMAYADGDKTLREIGDELGAGTILEGSVRRAGNRVRITAQLIDSRSDAHLWAETYDRELDDVFRIQMEIATEVAGALQATLSPEEVARIAEIPTGSLDAYDVYLRGRELYNEYTLEGNAEAIELFGVAVDMDPEFALAWAGLGDAYAQGAMRFGYAREFVDSAIAAAERAVRLRPDLGEGHKALGLALSRVGRYEEALDAYRRSAELNPSHHAAVNNIGTMVSGAGRLDEALIWYRRAARIAPNQEFTRTNAAEVYTLLGDFATADRWLAEAEADFPQGLSVVQQRAFWHLFQGNTAAAYETSLRALEFAPEDPGAHAIVGLLALWDGRAPAALERLEESVARSPDGGWVVHSLHLLLAAALIATGRADEADQHLDEAIAQVQRFRDGGDPSGFVEYDRAAVAALRGDSESALDLLEEAFDRGWRYAVRADDPVFASLRDQPRYNELMADVEADIARMRVEMEAQERAEGIR